MRKEERYWSDVVVKDPKRMNNFMSCLQIRPSREQIIQIVKQNGYKNVLDVGCSVGLDYKMYRDQKVKIDYHGIDITPEFIALAKKEFPNVDFRVGKGQALPFDDESFELVTCKDVLEHVNDPENVIKELVRVSKSDVILSWFIVPNETEELTIVEKANGAFHNNQWSIDRIKKILEDNKLELVERYKIDYELDTEVWLLRKV